MLLLQNRLLFLCRVEPGLHGRQFVADREIAEHCFCDDGIAMQNILLGAVDKGLGGCILRAVHKPALRDLFQLPERYDIMDVVALGKPAEVVQIEEVGTDGNTRYYRDEEGVHHVP
ncbi:MAG: nitroreductase family protein, partial [Desulfuromonadales bacterium]